MSKKILLLHGWGGSDFPHWQSWLAGELAKDYGYVCFFRFQDVEHPKLQEWLWELEGILQDFQSDIVIAHSLANTLWLHLTLANKAPQIEHLYLVAPPSLTCNVEELREFFPLTLPRQLTAKYTTLVTSTNDPYLSAKEADSLAQMIECRHIVLDEAGHINAESGYGEWAWILKEIKSTPGYARVP